MEVQAADDGHYSALLHSGPDAEWRSTERELARRGLPLPLYHRMLWRGVGGAPETHFISIQDASGGLVCGFAVEVYGSRALPGHSLLRVQRLGTLSHPSAVRAGLLALRELALSRKNILRVDVEVFTRDSDRRATIGRTLTDLGFNPRPLRLYSDTIAIELDASASDLLAACHPTARRHIRAVTKHPVQVREVTDPGLNGRLNELLKETMARTNGPYEPVDWDGVIDLCRGSGSEARLIGLFRTDVEGPDALAAYALGLHHGDHVEYATAASTRDRALRIPLAYPLAWDLIRWAKDTGAAWFDFGGISQGGHATTDDPTGGISDFKRYFSRNAVTVGEDWTFEPRPWRAALARRISSGANWLRKVR